MLRFSKRKPIMSLPKKQGRKIQMVLDCFVCDCFLGFFDVSVCFVLNSFAWDYFVYAPLKDVLMV